MSDKNKELESEVGETGDTTQVDQSKRKFSKAGLVAPVIMTLASKPVFAAQGLSNMISGNGSGCRGDIYHGGFSHGYWKNQQGDNAPNGSDVKWRIATNTTGQNYENVTIATAFGSHDFPVDTVGTDTLIAVVNSNVNPKCQIVSGYLNLFYYLNSASAGDYFLTQDQFWALNDGDTTTWDIPNTVDIGGDPIYADFADLITKNMHLGPGDVCTLVP